MCHLVGLVSASLILFFSVVLLPSITVNSKIIKGKVWEQFVNRVSLCFASGHCKYNFLWCNYQQYSCALHTNSSWYLWMSKWVNSLVPCRDTTMALHVCQVFHDNDTPRSPLSPTSPAFVPPSTPSHLQNPPQLHPPSQLLWRPLSKTCVKSCSRLFPEHKKILIAPQTSVVTG